MAQNDTYFHTHSLDMKNNQRKNIIIHTRGGVEHKLQKCIMIRIKDKEESTKKFELVPVSR